MICKNNIKTFSIFCTITALKYFFLRFQSIQIIAYTYQMDVVLEVLSYKKQFYFHATVFTELSNFWRSFNKSFSLISQYSPNLKFIPFEMFVMYSIWIYIQCIQVALHSQWCFWTKFVIYIIYIYIYIYNVYLYIYK